MREVITAGYTICPVLFWPPGKTVDILMNLRYADENYCHCPVGAVAPEVFSGRRGRQIPPWCETLASAPPGSALLPGRWGGARPNNPPSTPAAPQGRRPSRPHAASNFEIYVKNKARPSSGREAVGRVAFSLGRAESSEISINFYISTLFLKQEGE